MTGNPPPSPEGVQPQAQPRGQKYVKTLLVVCGIGALFSVLMVLTVFFVPRPDVSVENKAVLVAFSAAMAASFTLACWQSWHILKELKRGRKIPRALLAKATAWIRMLCAGFTVMVVFAALDSSKAFGERTLATAFEPQLTALLLFLAVGGIGLAVGPGYADYKAIWDHLDNEQPNP